MEYNFKGKIEELLEKERRTKKSLYDFLEMSMQGFDAMMKNNSFSAVRLAKVAEFFEIDISELYGSVSKKAEISSSFGDQVIQNMAENLDGMKNVLGEQLKVKDRQIDNLQRMNDGLQRMLESVLGKFEGVTDDQLSSVMTDINGNFNSYTMTVLVEALGMLKPAFKAAAHIGKVSGAELSYAGNVVITN